jgi:hypothetical protein
MKEDMIHDITPLNLIDMLENYGVYSLNAAQVKSIKEREDLGYLVNFWNLHSSVKEAYKKLIDIQQKNGSFRNWLERQEPTKAIMREFERLKLDYSKWDNPKIVFGYTNNEYGRGKVERIVLTPGKISEEIIAFANEFLNGKYSGFLSKSPGKVWHEIEPHYGSLKGAKREKSASTILDILENNLKKNESSAVALHEISKRRGVLRGDTSSLNGYSIILRYWRREPSHDFCQGNHPGVCVAFGSVNEEAMPNYLVDKGISLVSVYTRGNRIGQLYLIAATHLKSPILIADSLESSNVPFELYGAVENVLVQIAEETGFKRILVQDKVYGSTASNFVEYVKFTSGWNKYRSVVSKIGGTKSLELISLLDIHGYNYLGKMHYLDSRRKEFSTEKWSSNLSKFTAAGYSRSV